MLTTGDLTSSFWYSGVGGRFSFGRLGSPGFALVVTVTLGTRGGRAFSLDVVVSGFFSVSFGLGSADALGLMFRPGKPFAPLSGCGLRGAALSVSVEACV